MRLTMFGLSTAVLLASCSAGLAPSSSALPSNGLYSSNLAAPGGEEPLGPDKKARQFVYWTLYASCSYAQIQFTSVPLKEKSKAKSYYCSKQNGLSYTSGLAVDGSGQLWVLSFNGKYGGKPGLAAVFKLPLKSTSVQKYTFVLSGTNGPDALAFDPSGDLWVSSPGNSTVLEYTGPFTKSRTLKPAVTVDVPSGYNMYSIAFDKSRNLYTSNFDSTGTNSIGVLTPPYTGTPYFLNGVTAPGGIIFDKDGNLYASSNGSTPAIVRYDKNDLKSGDTPSIVDPTGIPSSSYEAAFAFSATGDLYAANCGGSGSAGVDVWPLSKKRFSSSLAPSVIYTTADVSQIGCAWGIAIK